MGDRTVRRRQAAEFGQHREHDPGDADQHDDALEEVRVRHREIAAHEGVDENDEDGDGEF